MLNISNSISNDDNNAAIHGIYGFGGLKIAHIFVTRQKNKMSIAIAMVTIFSTKTSTLRLLSFPKKCGIFKTVYEAFRILYFY